MTKDEVVAAAVALGYTEGVAKLAAGHAPGGGNLGRHRITLEDGVYGIEADEIQQAAVPVTYRVTTYWKHPRNSGAGKLTYLQTNRMSLSELLAWVLDDLPDDAVEIAPATDASDITSIKIHWSMVPAEVQYPFSHGVKRQGR